MRRHAHVDFQLFSQKSGGIPECCWDVKQASNQHQQDKGCTAGADQNVWKMWKNRSRWEVANQEILLQSVYGGNDAFTGNIHRWVVMIAYKIVCPNS